MLLCHAQSGPGLTVGPRPLEDVFTLIDPVDATPDRVSARPGLSRAGHIGPPIIPAAAPATSRDIAKPLPEDGAAARAIADPDATAIDADANFNEYLFAEGMPDSWAESMEPSNNAHVDHVWIYCDKLPAFLFQLPNTGEDA